MSEKKLEECLVEEATHIEMGGKVYKFGIRPRSYSGYDSENRVAKNFNSLYIEVCTEVFGWQLIHVDAFPILGIKPMREVEREPRECMAITVIAQRNGKDVVALLPTDDFELGMTVRCVEILEEEK